VLREVTSLMSQAADLSAREAAKAIATGALRSVDLTSACLERIASREETVQAWAHLNPEVAIAEARACDERRARGMPLGPLHGVPVGIKDVIDTASMPTENGSRLHAGRRPAADATVVRRLKRAGAVILG